MRNLISCMLIFISFYSVGQTINGSWYSSEIDMCLTIKSNNKLCLNELEDLKYVVKKDVIKITTGYSFGFFRKKLTSKFKIVKVTETTLILSQDLSQKNYKSFYDYMPKEYVEFIKKECTGLEK